MTNEEAAKELELIASVCQTTKLTIAAMMGANSLREKSSLCKETDKGEKTE